MGSGHCSSVDGGFALFILKMELPVFSRFPFEDCSAGVSGCIHLVALGEAKAEGLDIKNGIVIVDCKVTAILTANA